MADGLTDTTYLLEKSAIRWTGIFIVRAYDAVGNESANSSSLASTFLTPPSVGHPMVGTNERPAAVIGEHLMLIENVVSERRRHDLLADVASTQMASLNGCGMDRGIAPSDDRCS